MNEPFFTMYGANCRGNAYNTNYPNHIDVCSKDDFITAVSHDYVLATYKNNHRSNDDFISSDVIGMDCDNTHSDISDEWMTPKKIRERIPDVAFFIHYSRNHMKQKGTHAPAPRFHVFFPVPETQSADEYAEMKCRLMELFPEFDEGAKDAARFFFGTENPEVEFFPGSKSVTEYFVAPLTELDRIKEGKRNATMSHIAGCKLTRYGDTERAYSEFIEESKKCSPPLDNSELDSIWKSAVRFYNSKVKNSPKYIPPEEYDDSLIPTDFTDVGQAMVLADAYDNYLRYSPSTDYIYYNGIYWEESKPMAQGIAQELTFRQMMELHKLAKKENMDENYKEFLRNYKTFIRGRRSSRNITSTLKEARPMLLIDQADMDKDAFLLNTPGGTYDLHEGAGGKRKHSPDDLITKVTSVSPGTEGMQEWLDALNLIFCGDSELISYVQRIVGLAAIGKVYVEALIIAHGDGSNGKSTFWNVISRVLGTYAGNISADTLTVGCKRNVKPELAETKGKRLLIAAELEEGTRLNTSTIKQFCSTDEIFAEKKYKDPFSFTPSHTLVLYTNHLPKVGATDAGTWRRLLVIPFNAKFSGSGDKKNYADTLFETSGGAILTWIMEGAELIIREQFKLTAPECVRKAIDAYRDNNDWMNHFLEECCELDDTFREKSGELYTAYRNYCVSTGEYVRGTTDFYAALENSGFEKRKTKQGSFVFGMRLKPPFDELG